MISFPSGSTPFELRCHKGKPEAARPTRTAARESFLVDIHTVALSLLVYHIWSPLVWLHYYLLSLPIAIILMRRLPHDVQWSLWGTATRDVLGLLACVAVAFNPTLKFIHFENLFVQGLVIWGGALILLCVGLWGLGAVSLRQYEFE